MRPRRWTEQQLRISVKRATSIRSLLKLLGLRPAGGNYAQITKYLRSYKIPIRHFKGQGWNKGLRGNGSPRIPLKEILVHNSDYQSYKLKKRLFLSGLKSPHCELCGWAKKAPDGRIPLELDHMNGNRRDNRLSNLRILCPNCHSLQPTHRGLNTRKRVT